MTLLQRIRYVWVRLGVLSLLAAPIAAFLMFRAQNLPPDTWSSNDGIQVADSDASIRFEPVQRAAAAGWMLLPGCPADPYAYGPLARAVAARGLASVIVKVPYLCAPMAEHRATLQRRVVEVMDGCRECRWSLAGHSRGATHALRLVDTLPAGRVAGLIVIGSTHPRDRSYSHLKMPVMKIMASLDGVAPLEASTANRALLPPQTRWEVIEGGNHSQFGYYGFQLFDGRAAISREAQHETVAALVAEFLSGQ